MGTTNNPGHQISRGYPFEMVESRRVFTQRPMLSIGDDEKIQLEVNPDEFELPPVSDQRTGFEDFLMFRMIEFQEALTMAENQIQDMLDEHPFIPESYGFEVIHEHQLVTEAPIRVYVSKFNENISIFRKHGDVSDMDWNPALWTMLRKKADGTFVEIELNLPCSRIAYAAFFALGVQVKDVDLSELQERQAMKDLLIKEDPIRTPKPNENVTHKIIFNRDLPFDSWQETRCVFVNSDDDKDAITAAKFILETDVERPVKDVQFHELEIVEKY